MSRTRARFSMLLVGLFASVSLLAWPAQAQSGPLQLLGVYSFDSKMPFQDTTVGGLSGLAYDARRGVYYAVSDDRSEFGPARFYTLRINASLSGISSVDVLGYTTLDSDAATDGIQPYERNDTDLEDILLLPNDQLLISSERDRNTVPWIRRFALDGTLLGEVPLPDKFVPVTETNSAGQNVITRGVRSNLGFEGMALSPAGNALWVTNEETLAQDGPVTSVSNGTNVRALRYDIVGDTFTPGPEYVYQVSRLFATPSPADGAGDNGISGLLGVQSVLPQFDFLAMERSFVTGVGNDVNIYGVTVLGAQNVSGISALPNPLTGRPVTKTLLVNLTAAGVAPDNLEAMALGPRLPNGHPSLIVMSDDNFSAAGSVQINQFVLFDVVPEVGK
jgi:hypothetical protein